MADPAQPTAILRGHKTSVQAAAFVRLDSSNSPAVATPDTRLATGDSDGFVVLWDLAIVRPRAVWHAHEKSILGLAGWDDAAQIATHGRDHKLTVWQLGVDDEARLSTALPLETEAEETRPRPWIVYMLEIGTVNFCSFAWCRVAPIATTATTATTGTTADAGGPNAATVPSPVERYVAVTNALTLEAVDLFHLPSQRRVNTIQLGANEGMVMALALFYVGQTDAEEDSGTLVLLAAFENGAAVVATLDSGVDRPATIRYRAKTNTQPILSLDVAPDRSYFLTSAADAVVAKHPIPIAALTRRKSTAGSEKAEKDTSTSTPEAGARPPNTKSLLSLALAAEKETAQPQPRAQSTASSPEPVMVQTQPLQVANTKHAGQQGLQIRADGRIFATAGWDGRVRVYSAKTLREVAVLKWHQAGCFSLAFAPVGTRSSSTTVKDERSMTAPAGDGSRADTRALARRTNMAAVSVKAQRLQHALTAHWLAAGSKDGKVSLWDIF